MQPCSVPWQSYLDVQDCVPAVDDVEGPLGVHLLGAVRHLEAHGALAANGTLEGQGHLTSSGAADQLGASNHSIGCSES